ncbi:MAG: hypothetical protein RIG26_16030, partial [Thalassospira sp.]|uniref:hypothetical protein n=1 Tax=Thalassospira sp. TaxID=1912094 RepID=UPI0032EE0BCB
QMNPLACGSSLSDKEVEIMFDEDAKRRISSEVDTIEQVLYRFNGFGVVATLAFIGSHGKDFGYLVFSVLVVFFIGALSGLLARLGRVASELDEPLHRISDALASKGFDLENPTSELTQALGEWGLDVDMLKVKRKVLQSSYKWFEQLSVGCAGLGSVMGLIALYEFAQTT